MMLITVFKASPVDPTKPTEDLHIVAEHEFPETQTLERSRVLHDEAGHAIVNAMLATLPGGTVHAVLRELLERHASLLRVPSPVQADFHGLASAMRKVLPAPYVADLIARLDPVTPFVAFLRETQP